MTRRPLPTGGGKKHKAKIFKKAKKKLTKTLDKLKIEKILVLRGQSGILYPVCNIGCLLELYWIY